jgi:hypothetical protein
MIPISSDNIRSFRHRSKWLAYLLLKSVEALHKSGNNDVAAELMTADKKWCEIHHREVSE